MDDQKTVPTERAAAESTAVGKKAGRDAEKTVASLKALGDWINMKADRGQETWGLLAQALAQDETPVVGADIVFRVVLPDSTASGFVVEGSPSLLPSTTATTEGPDGAVSPYEPLKLGPVPGHLYIRAEPLDDQSGKVHADFHIEIADQVPAEVKLVKGGSQAFPGGDVHEVEVVVRVVDASGNPLDFGRVRIFVPDDDQSGSFIVVNGGQAGWHYGDCDKNGEVRFTVPLYVGTKRPGEFIVRVQRLGEGPYVDITYIAVGERLKFDI